MRSLETLVETDHNLNQSWSRSIRKEVNIDYCFNYYNCIIINYHIILVFIGGKYTSVAMTSWHGDLSALLALSKGNPSANGFNAIT